jgi:hypothetical protein
MEPEFILRTQNFGPCVSSVRSWFHPLKARFSSVREERREKRGSLTFKNSAQPWSILPLLRHFPWWQAAVIPILLVEKLGYREAVWPQWWDEGPNWVMDVLLSSSDSFYLTLFSSHEERPQAERSQTFSRKRGSRGYLKTESSQAGGYTCGWQP